MKSSHNDQAKSPKPSTLQAEHQSQLKIQKILAKFQSDDRLLESDIERMKMFGFSNERNSERAEEVEDIADDSEEEKSIKDVNMFQIRSMEAGAGLKSFSKHYSENDLIPNHQTQVPPLLLVNPFRQTRNSL